MGLRQQWNWLRQFGSNDDESTEASQQILCCDSFAALGVLWRKGSTRKTRHIELKAFFLQQMECATKNEFVQVGTSEMLADCLTKIQSTTNSVHLSELGLEINSSPELIRTWSKRSSGGGVRKFPHIFDKFVAVFLSKFFFFLIFPFSVTHSSHIL